MKAGNFLPSNETSRLSSCLGPVVGAILEGLQERSGEGN